jgi:zinc protease
MRAVNLLLQSRLFDTIRQDLGGTYSITSNLGTQKFPRPQYALRIEWTCDPAQTDALVQRVRQEIAYIRELRLSSQQLMLVRESLVRDFERDSQDNGYLLNAIVRDYQEDGGRNVADIEHLPDQINALTSAQIHDAAQAYLSGENSITVIQNPEKR